MMLLFQRSFLWLAALSVLGLAVAIFADLANVSRILSVVGIVSLAIGVGSVNSLKSYQYTIWIMVAIVCGLAYPSTFLYVGDFDMRNKWLILIVVQLVMFGMGTQMSIKDFTGLPQMSKGIVIGITCQFTIMPLLGFGLTRVFHFEPEVAAGVILIGSCSSGLASNVMVYLAKANLALSVTLTAIATLIAPLMTPLLMKLLAGTYIDIDFLEMFFQIIKIAIIPIGAALLAEALKTFPTQFKKWVYLITLLAIMWLSVMIFGFWSYISTLSADILIQLMEMANFMAGAILFGVLYFLLTEVRPKIARWMPLISMSGIVYFTLVTTAASRENIMQIGFLLILVAIIHNALGYTLGYSFSRLFKLDKESARTIALEVGLQNGCMASGLAGVMGKLATLGLASAVFSPWMNISGSLLANYWRKRSSLSSFSTA